MKKIIYLLSLVFCCYSVYSQTVTLPSGSTARASQAYTKNDSVYFQLGPYGSVRLPVYQDVQYKTVQTLVQRNAIPASFRKKGMLVWVTDSVKHFVLSTGITNSDWTALSTNVDLSGYAKLVGNNNFIGDQAINGVLGANQIFTGNLNAPELNFNATTPSTSSVIGISGVTLGTTTVKATLQALLYPSQPPLATLTGGSVIELMASGANLSSTLNWSATRQSATTDLATIVVAGIPQSYTHPTPGNAVSGTQTVSYPRNANITYSNIVTTADSKTATATTSFTFLPKRYWGRSSTNSPTSSDLIAALGGGSELNNTRAKGSFNITASGTNYVFYAYPSSLGDLTSLTIGGFESLGTFTKNVTSITNASGYVQNYNIYVSNNTFSATATNIVTN